MIVNRRFYVGVIALGAAMTAAVWVSAQGTAPPSGIRGFSAASSAAQAAREREMKAAPSAKLAEADFDVMTAEPHHTGSPYEIKLADYVSDQFKQFGIEATKYEYGVLLPWPGRRRIDVVAPDTLKLEVEEEKIRGDQWADKPGILPAYNAYSPSGDVTGEIVYVNYGIPADYDTLKKLGIDVKGKIVLARYGGSWRGIKPKVAAEHGAIACIIYSDPHEDGYFQGDVYPDGPFRGWGMIQRGSVMDMPRYPGDPSTPGRPSKPGVERLAMDKIETFAPIPVQPMSYRDGLELLKRLKGPVAPEAWRGSLPLTYHIGPGPAKVHMSLQMEYAQRRLINVVGRIAGAVAPDEWIIIGSHRDAWTFGASDSVSGHVSMMSVARAMGDMMKKGWKPRRSVLFVSWDGEEQGLLGSTEWVEDLAAELKAKAAIYVNRDAGAGGLNFGASAVHSLTPFLHELAQSIQPDGAATSLYDGWLERAREQSPARDGQPALDGAAGRCARIRIGLHGVSRSHRCRVAGHGAQRPRRRRQLSLDLRQPDLVQEIHRSAVHIQRARRTGDRRRAAPARRRRGAAVRLRVLRPADSRVHRRDRETGDRRVGGEREDRLISPACGPRRRRSRRPGPTSGRAASRSWPRTAAPRRPRRSPT